MPAGEKLTLTVLTKKNQQITIITFMPVSEIEETIGTAQTELKYWTTLKGINPLDQEVVYRIRTKHINAFITAPYLTQQVEGQQQGSQRRIH